MFAMSFVLRISYCVLRIAADSKARQVVVPTDITLLDSFFALLILSAVSCDISKCSPCILCLVISSSCTGLKVANPTCSVRYAVSMPFALSLDKSSSVKCNPAVGAAMAPLFFCIYSLVSAGVILNRISLYIGRQWDFAYLIKDTVEITISGKLHTLKVSV